MSEGAGDVFMANGDFNPEWCSERHEVDNRKIEELKQQLYEKDKHVHYKIDKEVSKVWKKLDSWDKRFFTLLLGMMGNLVLVIITLITLFFKSFINGG